MREHIARAQQGTQSLADRMSLATPAHTWIATAFVAAIATATACWAVPDHVQAGDAGELATVMLRGGVPHPSGYPWMRMLSPFARLLELMGLPPAQAAAYPPALAGVMGWTIVHRALVSARVPWTGAFVVIVAVLSPPVVLHVNDSEVWGPHLLFSALLLRLAMSPSRASPVTIGLLLGLALSHHLTAVLLIPMAVTCAWPSRVRVRSLVVTALEGLGGTLIGLLPYATLMIGSGGAWRWGNTQSLAGAIHHVLRVDYGTFALGIRDDSPPLLSLWSRSLSTVGDATSAGLVVHPIGAAIMLGTVAAAASWSCPPLLPRRVVGGLVGTVLASQLVFPAAQNIDPRSPFGAWILERFDLLTILLWVPLFAIVLGRLFGLARSRWARSALVIAGLSIAGSQATRSAAHGRPATDDSIERYALDVLETPAEEQTAIVLGTDDHRLFSILFAQEVLGAGEQTVYIDASLLSQSWYRAHVRRRWPALPEVEKPVELITTLWRDPARDQMPIYLANVFSRPASELPMVPEGVLLRVVPPDDRLAAFSLAKVVQRHRSALARYRGALPSTELAHPWAGDVAAPYVDNTAALIRRLRLADGEAEARGLAEDLQQLLARVAAGS